MFGKVLPQNLVFSHTLNFSDEKIYVSENRCFDFLSSDVVVDEFTDGFGNFLSERFSEVSAVESFSVADY